MYTISSNAMPTSSNAAVGNPQTPAASINPALQCVPIRDVSRSMCIWTQLLCFDIICSGHSFKEVDESPKWRNHKSPRANSALSLQKPILSKAISPHTMHSPKEWEHNSTKRVLHLRPVIHQTRPPHTRKPCHHRTGSGSHQMLHLSRNNPFCQLLAHPHSLRFMSALSLSMSISLITMCFAPIIRLLQNLSLQSSNFRIFKVVICGYSKASLVVYRISHAHFRCCLLFGFDRVLRRKHSPHIQLL